VNQIVEELLCRSSGKVISRTFHARFHEVIKKTKSTAQLISAGATLYFNIDRGRAMKFLRRSLCEFGTLNKQTSTGELEFLHSLINVNQELAKRQASRRTVENDR